jgi:DNA-binding CsgD family transcriptional regulator
MWTKSAHAKTAMNTDADAYIDFTAAQGALDAISSAPSPESLCSAMEDLCCALGLQHFVMLHLDGPEQEVCAVLHNLAGQFDPDLHFKADALRQLVDRRIPVAIDGELHHPHLQHAIGVSMGSGLTTCILLLGRELPLEREAMTDRMGLSCLAATNALDMLASAHRAKVIPLTERELECLTYAAAGGSAKVIGRHLGISSRTVEEYLQRCKSRLGTPNTLSASAQALRRGWISSRDIDLAGRALVNHQSGASQRLRR